MWWQFSFVLVLGMWLHVVIWRHATPRGVQRLRELEPTRARAILDNYTSRWVPWLMVFYGVLLAIAALTAALSGHRSAAVLHGLAAVSVLTLPLGMRRTRAAVVAALAPRRLPRVALRERSRRRTRRVAQGAMAAGAGSVVGVVGLVLGRRLEEPWLSGAGAVGWFVALCGVLGAGWALVWRYGDEEPVDDDRVAEARG